MSSIAAAVGEKTYHIDLSENHGKDILCALLEMLEDYNDLRVLGYQGKEVMVQCSKICERYPGFDFDVELASYLINPSGGKHDLDSSMTRFLGIVPEE